MDAKKLEALSELFRDEKIATEVESLRLEVNDLKARQPQKIYVNEKKGNKEVVINGRQHFMFEPIVYAVDAGVNLMLVGGAGSGKTTVVKNVAKALDLEFYPVSIGNQTTKSDLMGYMSAVGEYIETAIYKSYKSGGVLLLDEFDAGNAGTLTILNAILSNDVIIFPNGEKVTRSTNFKCVVACNTFGQGNDRKYVGRNKLDAASLDRFAVMNYETDKSLEASFIGIELNQNTFEMESERRVGRSRWLAWVHQLRDACAYHKVELMITPRATLMGNLLLDKNFYLADVLDMVVFKGVKEDTRKKLVKHAEKGLESLVVSYSALEVADKSTPKTPPTPKKEENKEAPSSECKGVHEPAKEGESVPTAPKKDVDPNAVNEDGFKRHFGSECPEEVAEWDDVEVVTLDGETITTQAYSIPWANVSLYKMADDSSVYF